MHRFKPAINLANKLYETKYLFGQNNTRFFIVHDERTRMTKVHGDNGS